MAGNMTSNAKGKPSVNNKSNTVRSILFTFVLVCFGVFLIANMNYGGVEKKEIPISEVIARANDPKGNIAKLQ